MSFIEERYMKIAALFKINTTLFNFFMYFVPEPLKHGDRAQLYSKWFFEQNFFQGIFCMGLL
jgi:hypothetical protein